MTRLARFESNDAAVLTVSLAGRVTAVRAGGTAVRAAFQSGVTASTFTVPHARVVDESLFAGRRNFIDDHVFTRLKELKFLRQTRQIDDALYWTRMAPVPERSATEVS